MQTWAEEQTPHDTLERQMTKIRRIPAHVLKKKSGNSDRKKSKPVHTKNFDFAQTKLLAEKSFQELKKDKNLMEIVVELNKSRYLIPFNQEYTAELFDNVFKIVHSFVKSQDIDNPGEVSLMCIDFLEASK